MKTIFEYQPSPGRHWSRGPLRMLVVVSVVAASVGVIHTLISFVRRMPLDRKFEACFHLNRPAHELEYEEIDSTKADSIAADPMYLRSTLAGQNTIRFIRKCEPWNRFAISSSLSHYNQTPIILIEGCRFSNRKETVVCISFDARHGVEMSFSYWIITRSGIGEFYTSWGQVDEVLPFGTEYMPLKILAAQAVDNPRHNFVVPIKVGEFNFEMPLLVQEGSIQFGKILQVPGQRP
jgi:hypothetical protein